MEEFLKNFNFVLYMKRILDCLDKLKMVVILTTIAYLAVQTLKLAAGAKETPVKYIKKMWGNKI